MKINLRKRILLGYLVPLVLMLGVSLMVYWSIGTLRQISSALDQSSDIAAQVGSLHLGLTQMQRSTRGYIMWKNETSRQRYQSARLHIQQALKRLNETVKDSAQLENLRRFSDLSARMEAEEQSYMDLIDAGKAPEALSTFRKGESVKLVSELDAIAAAMDKREAQIVEARHEAQGDALARLMSVTVWATAVAALLALVLGAWIAARISQSIGEAVAGMTTSSTEIAATVDQHERTVTQQAAAVNETTTTVEELGASARQSASQAESSAAAVKQALNLTQEGIATANRATESMGGMKQKIGSVAEQILRLSEQAGQIGGIARVVGELASETNMLALNAAVEAARAGEQGKGFAVVATEVRKLADQSKKSAERTNALVADIQKATNSAVMVTEEGSRTADEVSAIVQKMVESFDAIAGAANSVSESSQQVMLNSKQQATALGQVTEAMQSLSAGSKQMAAGTAQTKIGVQKLNEVALGLRAMV